MTPMLDKEEEHSKTDGAHETGEEKSTLSKQDVESIVNSLMKRLSEWKCTRGPPSDTLNAGN